MGEMEQRILLNTVGTLLFENQENHPHVLKPV